MMNKNQNLKINWPLCSLICSSFLFFNLLSCSHFKKDTVIQPSSQSLQNRAFEIRWKYFSADTKKTDSFRSYVFFKNDQLLRMDVVAPVVKNTLVTFILNKNNLFVRIPFKRAYYQGPFRSQDLFEDFDSFSSGVFFALLKHPRFHKQTLPSWTCTKKNINKFQCQKQSLTIEWHLQKNQIVKFVLRSVSAGSIEGKVAKSWNRNLKNNSFTLATKGYKKQKHLSLD